MIAAIWDEMSRNCPGGHRYRADPRRERWLVHELKKKIVPLETTEQLSRLLRLDLQDFRRVPGRKRINALPQKFSDFPGGEAGRDIIGFDSHRLDPSSLSGENS